MGGHEFKGDCGKAVLPEVLLAVASEQAHVAAPVDVHVDHAALHSNVVICQLTACVFLFDRF